MEWLMESDPEALMAQEKGYPVMLIPEEIEENMVVLWSLRKRKSNGLFS